jgi:KaiC/GvpD/RAD55 family RecA-like ATPase
MVQQLSANFIPELFKLAFVKKSVLEVLREHLKYQYIPTEIKEYKFILQSIINQYDLTQKLPSYGLISQQFQSNIDVQNALQKIKDSDIIDVDLALKQLYSFIKDVRLKTLLINAVESFENGKKEEALRALTEEVEDLSSFSLSSTKGQFLKLFEDFEEQMKDRQNAKNTGEDIKEKVPIGIDILDILTDGGIARGETALWIMPSGVGKSTALKWNGMYACRLGYKVLHVQLEGKKSAAFDKYAQIVAGLDYGSVKWGNIPADKTVKMKKVIEGMKRKHRDIHIYASEKFGETSMIDVREQIVEYNKIEGCFPDLLILDSLDLAVTGVNKKIDYDPDHTKARLQKVAQQFSDLCVEFDMSGIAATQTSSIPREKLDNPAFVITREHTEGDRTLVKPFSYVFTGNQTKDEKKKDMLRINIDKFRYYSLKDGVYPIKSAYKFGKFYDRKASMSEFGYLYENK